MAKTHSLISSVVNVDGRPGISSLVTIVRPFLNIVSHSQTLYCGKALFPYCAEILRRISAPGTPSVHKNLITERCSSSVQKERGATTLNLL
jgi:hypothetical protein